tara:strand:- start:2118 stop:2792 length:675 start_codon:yes stop_codon:yes gene_type:complete
VSLKNFIKNKKQTHFSYRGIEIFVREQIVNPDIDLKKVILKTFTILPDHLISTIKSIYVGQFDFLKNQSMSASYYKSTIFLSNEQKDENDIFSDLVHEIAHSVEEKYTDFLYADKKIKNEFLIKKNMLKNTLSQIDKDVSKKFDFKDLQFNEDFDDYLYNEIGYKKLNLLTAEYFLTPYSATSIREYFAECFEMFYEKNNFHRIKNVSPVLFKKISDLIMEDFS